MTEHPIPCRPIVTPPAGASLAPYGLATQVFCCNPPRREAMARALAKGFPGWQFTWVTYFGPADEGRAAGRPEGWFLRVFGRDGRRLSQRDMLRLETFADGVKEGWANWPDHVERELVDRAQRVNAGD